MSVTDGKLRRTRLWALFDRLAFALVAGAITNLVVMCPPQHGKSQYWSKYFPAWYLQFRPNHRVILGSYAAGYAAEWGRETRDLIARRGILLAREIRQDVSGASEWKLDGYEGGMVTAGIQGGIAGRPAELAIADDIIADANAGESPTEKAKAWRWFEEELTARLQRGGRRVVIMTRRAIDDPIGRILQLHQAGKETWTVVKLPAIAEEDETWPEWNWSRKTGEALVPELHPLADLQKVERSMGQNGWAGLYQQRPYPRGGGDIKSEWFRIVDADPAFDLKCRSWDLAYSESPTAKRTAGVMMTKRREETANKYHISDIVYGRWGSGTRNKRIVEQAKIDGKNVPILFEQEGGSGGPTQIDELVRLLDGYTVIRAKAAGGGSKSLRADAMAAQAEVGNMTIRSAEWNGDFHGEIDSFPGGPTIDMVDASAHAYNWLAAQEEITDIPDIGPIAGSQMFPSAGPLFHGPSGGRF